MVSLEDVDTVLSRIRPLLQADQGDIELVAVVGCDARVRLTGACARCPNARVTLFGGIEAALRQQVEGFGRVLAD
jgi:Fe-S cluster biogenesis protein NfuA